MKRHTIFAVFLAAGVALTGCSEKGSASSQSEPAESQSIYILQAGDTQVTGEVTDIVGNEVTLALGEVSEDNSPPELPDGEAMPEGEESPDMADGEGGPQGGPGEGFEIGGDGTPPQGGNANGGPGMGGEGFQRGDGGDFQQRGGDFSQSRDGEGFPGGRNGEGTPQMGGGGRGRGSSATIEKSGETASYTIPVGMTVTGASGRSNDYSAVSVGMILRLTINSNGYVVAAEIL